VNWTEPEYPQSLLQIYDPPVVLYVRGAGILDTPTLATVGTRRTTVYGTQMGCGRHRSSGRKGGR
jgi:predicted Rossmann fold nucleotide-binding protein DprA/Smf involved in DNA uptake